MRYALLSSLIAVLGAPVLATDLTMMVDRSERGVEMFIKFPTSRTEDLLAPYPAGFLDANGLVDITPFREGTADLGDDLWINVSAELNGQSTLFEAMSMMVHPDDLPVDFDDPIDGFIAIAVCNVNDPDARFSTDLLSTYAGFIAWEVDGHAELAIQFPSAIEIEVTEYLKGREISSDIVTLAHGEALTLDAVTTWDRWRFW